MPSRARCQKRRLLIPPLNMVHVHTLHAQQLSHPLCLPSLGGFHKLFALLHVSHIFPIPPVPPVLALSVHGAPFHACIVDTTQKKKLTVYCYFYGAKLFKISLRSV